MIPTDEDSQLDGLDPEEALSLLEGAYDLHVHCSPDVVPRSQDAYQLAKTAAELGMAGVGLKDHTTSTVGRCFVLNKIYPQGPRFYSSLVLNPPVGGLEPASVEAALASGVDIIYFPTYSAQHHIETLGIDCSPVPHPRGGVWSLSVFDANKKLKPQVISILKLIAEFDAVLATGHISPEESMSLLTEANKLGVHRKIVTHASESVPNMSIQDQKTAIELGAWIEHSFLAVTPCCPGQIEIETLVQQIQATGTDRVILSSDFGQLDNKLPLQSFSKYLNRLISLGIPPSDLKKMITKNPQTLMQS